MVIHLGKRALIITAIISMISIIGLTACSKDDQGKQGNTTPTTQPQLNTSQDRPNNSTTYLGVEVGQLISAWAEKLNLPNGIGLVVFEVDKDSPAEKAGMIGFQGKDSILQADVILSIDNQPLKSPDQLIDIVRSHKPGDKVILEILRQGKRRNLDITLALQPVTEPARAK
ncbi:MAG: PDZ domain-containing protein [Acidobacteriota bacterium]